MTDDIENDDSWMDDDIPWADPEIKKAYEAALGKFVLAYNQIDYYLGHIIALVLRNNDEPVINQIRNQTLTNKLLLLRCLRHTTEGRGLADLPFDKIEEINGKRNNYAHGHMEQNPFDGSFEIIQKKKLQNPSTKELLELAKNAEELWDRLRIIEMQYEFGDVSAELNKTGAPGGT